MTVQTQPRSLSPEKYLELESTAEEKSEYRDGEIVPMTGGVYKPRWVAERTFAWVDKFKRLLIRFERRDAYFLGAHHIAFAMINLRHLIAAYRTVNLLLWSGRGRLN
jgi:transposase